MTDTTAPIPLALSFSGINGTLTWTETGLKPVLNVLGQIVSGAGNAAANGVYPPSSAPDSNGNRYYTLLSGGTTFYLYWDAPTNPDWWLSDVLLQTGQGYNGNSGTTLASGPAGSYNQAGDPHIWGDPPTITGFGINQGLTITGLSGGPVTISNVVTTGTTTTFTTSRAIAPNETGGSLNGAAGAFSDSATPASLNAAFSIPITSNQFSSSEPLTLTANPQLVGGVPAIVLTWTGG